ncbi:hypothetical protein TNCV_1539351 [Trichonephila clavipes]|nr:hypothetical protein TNCV_1539351 [Trichonephila clavipes]
MTSFISWNCRGLRTRLDDLKSIISTYQPACVALQETFLKSTMTMQVRGYNCVRRDVDGDTSPNGGVCLLRPIYIPVMSSHCTHHYRLWLFGFTSILWSQSVVFIYHPTMLCTSGFESFSQSIASSIYFAR